MSRALSSAAQQDQTDRSLSYTYNYQTIFKYLSRLAK
jgi:hypothetical protein